MISVNGHKIEPTRFPDGTTQVWKLPPEVLVQAAFEVDWRYEREDEFFSVAQLRTLRGVRPFGLRVPYLPYARQDKEISNELTFSLRTFALLLNSLDCDYVSAVDVHNPDATKRWVSGFRNEPVDRIHNAVIHKVNPDLIVFPDAGALTRYPHLSILRHLVFEKERNQATGSLMSHVLTKGGSPELLADGKRLLIVDDICDGGATFLSIARTVRGMYKDVEIHLFVTHGLFSKGREALTSQGIELHTTNSLPRNADGIAV